MRTDSAVPLPVPPALFSRESGVRRWVPRSFQGPGCLVGHQGRGAGDTQRTARPSPSPGHTWAGTRPAERGRKTGASGRHLGTLKGAPSGRPLAARGHQEAETDTRIPPAESTMLGTPSSWKWRESCSHAPQRIYSPSFFFPFQVHEDRRHQAPREALSPVGGQGRGISQHIFPLDCRGERQP